MTRADETPPQQNTSAQNVELKNVVLLGIGHTNAHVVDQWASDPIPGFRLVCISNFPAATYSGMLPGTLGQQFQPDQMQVGLAELAKRAGAELVLAEVSGLDLPAGEVRFADREPIPFAALSIGLGSVPAGSSEHETSPLVVPIKPMQTFLPRLETRLNQIEFPAKIAIVGGGVASVEVACCLDQRLREQNRHAEITIYTVSDHVADGMTSRSVRKIEALLRQRNIDVVTGSRVEGVTESGIVTASGQNHAAACVVWATGAASPPLIARLGLKTDDQGFIATSDTLVSLTDGRVFAVGDCGTIVQSPSPKAGVYAVRQSPILWENLRAKLIGGKLVSFRPQSDFLKILNTGDGKALLQYRCITIHARWCWHLKTWIDRGFIRRYQSHEKRDR